MKTKLIFGLLCSLASSLIATSLSAQNLPSCLRDTPWGENVAPHGQRMEFELIERHGETSIIGIKFTPLSGEFAKLYGFFRHNGDCVVSAYIVGAFSNANSFQSVDTLTRTEDIRYNQDYYTNSSQSRITITELAPRYDVIKPKALKLLR